MGLKSPWPKIGASLSLSLLVASVLFGFQNCGKAGFDSSSDEGAMTALSSLSVGDKRFQDAPFPYDLQLNTISYMTCPKASTGGATDGSRLNRPFYNFRAGGYDNSVYQSTFLPDETDAKQISNRLKGGLGLSQAFLNFVQSSFNRRDAEIVNRGLTSFGSTVNAQPALAMIYDERSRDSFNYDNGLIVPLLSDLSNVNLIDRVSAQAGLSVPTERVSSFSALDSSRKGVTGSMSWGTSETNVIGLNREIAGGSLVLATVFTQGGIKNLLAPEGSSPVDRVYGRGYQFQMSSSSTPVSGFKYTAGRSSFIRGIRELDLSQKPPADLSDRENSSWSCFSLRIVRPADRLDQNTGQPKPTAGTFDFIHPSGTRIPGVRAACPNQSSGNVSGTRRVQFEIARRVLPAEYWMINTDPEFMCAVPTQWAVDVGSCYASGDTNASYYVNYAAKTTEDCGASKNECPAYVSVCYRTN